MATQNAARVGENSKVPLVPVAANDNFSNVQRHTRDAAFSSPTVSRFEKEQSLEARVHTGRKRLRVADNAEAPYVDEPQEFRTYARSAGAATNNNARPSFLGTQARFRVAIGLCAIFAGAQSVFALMASGVFIILPISFGLWVIACACSVAGFIVISSWLKVDVLESPGLAICTVSVAVLSFIPILNIIPWMAFWVWAIYLSGNIR
jgi:hypothetical protein